MGLDYTDGCVNFRDVGEFVNLLAGTDIMKTGLLLRGGKINFVDSLEQIGSPKSIVNLRKGPDPQSMDLQYFHFPISNDYEKYETSDKEVRKWLNSVISTFAENQIPLPTLVHCTSGKDRTGVVVAALLKIIGVSDEIIVQEYMLSEGEVKEEWIRLSLDGIEYSNEYFNRVKQLETIRTTFCK